jgi:hypothetical protein
VSCNGLARSRRLWRRFVSRSRFAGSRGLRRSLRCHSRLT